MCARRMGKEGHIQGAETERGRVKTGSRDGEKEGGKKCGPYERVS